MGILYQPWNPNAAFTNAENIWSVEQTFNGGVVVKSGTDYEVEIYGDSSGPIISSWGSKPLRINTTGNQVITEEVSLRTLLIDVGSYKPIKSYRDNIYSGFYNGSSLYNLQSWIMGADAHNFAIGATNRLTVNADGITVNGAVAAGAATFNSTIVAVGTISSQDNITATGFMKSGSRIMSDASNGFSSLEALHPTGNSYRWTLANDDSLQLQVSTDKFVANATTRAKVTDSYFAFGSKASIGTTGLPRATLDIAASNDTDMLLGASNSLGGLRVAANATTAVIDAVDATLVGSYRQLQLTGSSVIITGNSYVEVIAGGSSALTLTSSAVSTTRTAKIGDYTVATLPSAAASAGYEANVTDSSVTTFGSTVAGSGSSRVKVYSNGTNWTIQAA